MQITITNPRLIAGIAAACAAYNATLPEGTDPLTPEQYLQRNAEAWAESYAAQFKIGEISGAEVLLKLTAAEFDAVKKSADPDVAAYVEKLKAGANMNVDEADVLVEAGVISQAKRDTLGEEVALAEEVKR